MTLSTIPALTLALSGTYQANNSTLAIILVVLLVITAVYMAIVVAELVLVGQARRQRAQWRSNKQQALDYLTSARNRLTELSIAVGSARHGEPYKSLHENAQQLTDTGFRTIDALLERIEQNATQDIPPEPAMKALLLQPLAAEIARHRRQQRDMEAIVAEVVPSAEVVTQVEALSEEIATLGQREKALAAQLRQKAVELNAAIQAEVRPALPLEDERRMMARASQSLDTIEHLLQADQPDETEVVAAFPMRTYVERDLETVAKNWEQIKASRETMEKHLLDANNRLAALREDIEKDVAAGARRNRLAEQARVFSAQLDSQKIALGEGRYIQLANDAPALVTALQAEQETIRRLHAARDRIAATRDGAALQLDDMRAVIKETPAQFDRDATRKLAQQIEGAIASLEALLPSEDLNAMAGSQAIEQQLDTWLKQAAQAQQVFEANRQSLDRYMEALNDDSINAAVAAAERAAAILRACHPNYWIGATPDELQVTRTDLKSNWRALVTDLGTITESGFAEALHKTSLVKQQQDGLNTLAADTDQVEARARGDELRAQGLINDAQFTRQLDEFENVAPHSDDLAPMTGQFIAAYQALKQEAQTPTPYWADIIARATKVRDDLTTALNTYRQQLTQATNDLERLMSRLEQMRGTMVSLAGHPVLDFESYTQEPLQDTEKWLVAHANVDKRYLREVQATVAGGEAIRLEAQKRISVMRQQQSTFAAGQTAVEAILNDANALISQGGQLQKDGNPYGASVWAPRALAPARRPLSGIAERLSQLTQPEPKHDPETALAELNHIRSDADSVVAPLTDAVHVLEANVTELRALDTELKQLEERARELNARSTSRQSKWSLMQERIADLEDRWTHATSFEEARDALKAAQDLARESIAASLMAQSQAPAQASRSLSGPSN